MMGALKEARAKQSQLDQEVAAGDTALVEKFGPVKTTVQDVQSSQEARAAEALRGIGDLQPAKWEHLREGKRLMALQDAETALAGVQRRVPLDVIPKEMEPRQGGYYDGESIYINRKRLREGDVSQNLGTVIHEGRHAYQHHAVKNPGVHPDAVEVDVWRENRKPENYIRPDKNFEEYYAQPVEVDARKYKNAVLDKLNNPEEV